MNTAKLKQLGKNALIPGIGALIALSLAFSGFSWWFLLPSLIFGGGASLVLTTPQNLKQLPSNKKLRALEAKYDKELQSL